MNIMVFGASSALGRRFCELAAVRGHSIVRATRNDVHYTDIASLHSFIKLHNPDAIVNLAALKPSNTSIVDMILINALFPHMLAQVADSLGINVLHVSTESIFSGHNRYKNTIESIVDPTTYYGKSRAMGEVLAPNVCVVRTSYLGGDSGIVKWLSQQPPGSMVEGWVNWKWSGSTLEAVSHGLIDMLEDRFTNGIKHLATADSISKFDVVLAVIKKLGLDLRVRGVHYPYINRALVPTNVIQSLEEALYDDDCAFNLQAQADRRPAVRSENPTVNA